jgi:hypothetical protein
VTNTVQRIANGRLASDEATLASSDVHYVALRALFDLYRAVGSIRLCPMLSINFFRRPVNAGDARDDFAILSKFMREQTPESSAKVSIA